MLKKIFRVIYEYTAITFGSLLVALSLNLFLVPNKIAAGGFSGIATVVYYVSHYKLPVGMTMLALNIPAFILGIRTIGVDFWCKKCLWYDHSFSAHRHHHICSLHYI